jgi:hypothetical protein
MLPWKDPEAIVAGHTPGQHIPGLQISMAHSALKMDASTDRYFEREKNRWRRKNDVYITKRDNQLLLILDRTGTAENTFACSQTRQICRLQTRLFDGVVTQAGPTYKMTGLATATQTLGVLELIIQTYHTREVRFDCGPGPTFFAWGFDFLDRRGLNLGLMRRMDFDTSGRNRSLDRLD